MAQPGNSSSSSGGKSALLTNSALFKSLIASVAILFVFQVFIISQFVLEHDKDDNSSSSSWFKRHHKYHLNDLEGHHRHHHFHNNDNNATIEKQSMGAKLRHHHHHHHHHHDKENFTDETENLMGEEENMEMDSEKEEEPYENFYDNSNENNDNNVVLVMNNDDNNNIAAAPYLLPIIKPLPALAIIEEDEQLAKDGLAENLVQSTLDGSNPTMVGITIILQRFMMAFHQATKDFAAVVEYKRTVREKRQLERQKRKNDPNAPNTPIIDPNDFPDYVKNSQGLFGTYVNLVQEHLMPLDSRYRGKTIFPVRDDDSIFISIVSFRDHLLGETIYDIYNKAKHPEKVYLGIVVQNCFGIEYTCKTGIQVIGKNANGGDITDTFDTTPDINGIEQFCNNETTTNYCKTGHIRALYVNETEAVGPAVARYFASKLWGGETYFMQIDSHLLFAKHWDAQYIHELKISKSYPKSLLSAYPPGFKQLFRLGNSSGTRLCGCYFSDIENNILRISTGRNYPKEGYMNVTIKQIAFIAAGFFFVPSGWLADVPYDPFLPWCFMGEEILLTMRSWTSGWNLYAPRSNLIAHQYRPGSMGLPKFWETATRTVGATFHNHASSKVIQRIKLLVGYPGITNETINAKLNRDPYQYDDMTADNVLMELDHYGLGKVRSREEYLEHTHIDFVNKKCPRIDWCADMKLE